MVTVTERPLEAQNDRQSGLLSERVERDITDTLTEYGGRVEEGVEERVGPTPTLAYGIPMAGVRYYTYAARD